MKTLSLWESVCLVFYSGWLNSRFYYFPTEKNLLISFWYDHAYYRDSKPEDTVYNFLDSRVRALEEKIANPEGKKGARNLERYLLEALHREDIRRKIVDFLESPSPKEDYRPVMEAIRSAWRTEAGGGLSVGAEARMLEIRGNVIELEVENKHCDVGIGEKISEEMGDGEGGKGMERLLHAKAYIIAVQLLLELEGRESEFGSLSVLLPDLRRFIWEKFGVEKLPGRLEDFKGYSYKEVLNGKNSAKRGQLRMPFKQIMEHPEVFGEKVAGRALEILEKNFD